MEEQTRSDDFVKVGFLIHKDCYDQMVKTCEQKGMELNNFVEIAIDDLCFLHTKNRSDT